MAVMPRPPAQAKGVALWMARRCARAALPATSAVGRNRRRSIAPAVLPHSCYNFICAVSVK